MFSKISPMFFAKPLRNLQVLATCVFVMTFAVSDAGWAAADTPLLQPNDTVALVGGTFIERLQRSGDLEIQLQTRRPEWKLRIRNLGWSGDDVHGIARKVFDEPEVGFQRLLRDIKTANPTVVVIAYGNTESSDKTLSTDRFEQGLERLVQEMETEQRRIILLQPTAMPGYRVPHYKQNLADCNRAIQKVAQEQKLPVITTPWTPSPQQVSRSGLVPNESGYQEWAKEVADQLLGAEQEVAAIEPSRRSQLAEKISAKNQLFFHRYRPQNETYLFLFRKHEQGNNATEIPEFEPLIKQADDAIRQLATPAVQLN